jgi:hypothetical protein
MIGERCAGDELEVGCAFEVELVSMTLMRLAGVAVSHAGQRECYPWFSGRWYSVECVIER